MSKETYEILFNINLGITVAFIIGYCVYSYINKDDNDEDEGGPWGV